MHDISMDTQLHLKQYPEGQDQELTPLPMPTPSVPLGAAALGPTLSQSTTVSQSLSSLGPLALSPASFAVPSLSYQTLHSLHGQVPQSPPLPPGAEPTPLRQPDVDPVVISTTPTSVLLEDPVSAVTGPVTHSAVPTPHSTRVESPVVIQEPPPPNRATTQEPPRPTIPYPLAIHIAILSTLCPTLAHPAPLPTTITLSPDLTVTPPSPPTPPESTPPATLGLIPAVLASLKNLPLAEHAHALVDTGSETWDLDKLAHDPDYGVLASCVDLASLYVLEPVKSQQQPLPEDQDKNATGWQVVAESVSEYWAYLMKSVKDVGLMAQLKQSFGEYLDRRDKLASTQVKHQALMAALGPETSEEQAKAALKDHIHNLHVYNEYQDLAQSIMGQLADMDGVTVKQVYEDLGIDVDDELKKKARAA